MANGEGNGSNGSMGDMESRSASPVVPVSGSDSSPSGSGSRVGTGTRKKNLLITGASGGLARIISRLLTDEYQLVGVDPRPLQHRWKFPGEFFQVDYGHRKMAEIFRQHRFDALLHLGRIRVTTRTSLGFRFRLNVLGTQNLLKLARKHGIEHLVTLSTYHVYGAHDTNHFHITEDEPLRAAQSFPELSDAVEMDHAATTFLWKYSDIRSVVLRPVNIIGPRIRNTISQLLRRAYTPTLLGYDPLIQFIHERDMARAIMLALKSERSGIYNVAGQGLIPYTSAVRLSGGVPLPLPTPVAYPFVRTINKFGVPFPEHLVDYFRYPTVLSDEAFRTDFKFEPQYTTLEALRSLQ